MASPLDSRMIQGEVTKGLTTTVNSNGTELKAPCLRSDPEVVSHLQKRYSNDEAITLADAAILCSTQPAGTTPLRCGKALFAKAINVGDVEDESTQGDTLIEEMNEYIRYSHRHY